ncbi:MAG: TorD/DmsD family molecular chaperone [Roseinatronobacter sp.]
MTSSQPETGQATDLLDQARGDQYRFLATLLAAAPSDTMLSHIAGLRGDDTLVGREISALANMAATSDAPSVAREYFELFVGVGRGELLPYASFYLTGFLNERPLADLRSDLARLGVARAQGRHEPEDHIALLFEVMADMAHGTLAIAPAQQAAFFARHIAPWAEGFFNDLLSAPSARFYRPVAGLGQVLVTIEAKAFALAA